MEIVSDIPEQQATAVVINWARAVQAGQPGYRFWVDPNSADKMFAVRSCKVLSAHRLETDPRYVDVSVRVESSNRAGMPITADWTFFMFKTPQGWKINLIVEH